MYKENGQEIFVVDGHMHFWDANPENWRNEYGEGWIRCFYDFHTALSPEEYVWTFEKYCKYGEETLINDLFAEGYVDVAILNSTYLTNFTKTDLIRINRITRSKQNILTVLFSAVLSTPEREEAGLDAFRQMVEDYPIQGLKLYTAEWRNGSKGWRLNDPWAYKYFELADELGVKNIHVHKGPTVYPLNRDAFDVADVDYAATDFPNLNFIIEHIGLPRLDDFCWIATQEKNVYAGMSVAMAFIHSRPKYFAEIVANLLFWLGEDKMIFGSDYAIWTPKWLIEKFMALELPDDIKEEYGVDITPEAKRKVLGENAARLYGIDLSTHQEKLSQDEIGVKLAAGA